MKVYLASRYSTKDEVKKKSLEMARRGVYCTSRWLDEKSAPNITLTQAAEELGEKEMIEIAKTDLVDIMRADVTVLFTVDPNVATVRGGRHFESGFAFALQLMHEFGWMHGSAPNRKLVTVGPKENIFHFIPDIRNFATWEECLEWLVEEKKKREEGTQQPTQPGLKFGEDAPVERCH